MPDREPGIYYGMPRAEYDAIDAINWSRLRHILRSPAHMLAEIAAKTDTPAMAFGRVAHEVILEGQRNFVVGGPVNPKTGKSYGAETKAFAEWAAAQSSPVLASDDAERLDGMQAALAAHTTAQTILDGTNREVSLVWVNEETGLTCKARVDFARLDVADDEDMYFGDYKTALDASFREFYWATRRTLYDAQMAHYEDGLQTLTGMVPLCYVIAQEKESPWAVAVYSLGRTVMDHGRAAVTRALSVYAECMRTGLWPAYPDSVQVLELD
jgi:exodeoxyribonuclease VIII